jgi:hypothetical protein
MRKKYHALRKLSPDELQKYREKQARLKELFCGPPAKPENGLASPASTDKYPDNEIRRSPHDRRTDEEDHNQVNSS